MYTVLQKWNYTLYVVFEIPFSTQQLFGPLSITISVVIYHLLSVFKMGKLKSRGEKEIVKAPKEMVYKKHLLKSSFFFFKIGA